MTDRCNLRCRYCMPEQGIEEIAHDLIMRYEEIELFVRAAASIGFSKVRLTGGEPLVRKGITNLVGALKKIEGVNDLSLTTNGVLLFDMAEGLRAAGINRINISLDTLKPERFFKITRRDLFDRVIAGIDAALAAGMDPVKINVVLMRGINDDEIMDFVALAADRPLSVRFIEFMPARDDWDGTRVMPSVEVLSQLRKRYTMVSTGKEAGGGPSDDYRIDGFVGTVGFISPISRHFCDGCNRLRLTADGMIRGCLFSDDELYILPFLRAGKDIEEIAGYIKQAVAHKPRAHAINDIRFRSCQRSMSAIGG